MLNDSDLSKSALCIGNYLPKQIHQQQKLTENTQYTGIDTAA
jgi:hypothetical protein